MYVTPCQQPGADPEQWFPVDERPDSPGVTRAAALCRTCHVADACLRWALDHDARAGVWGGLTTGQRDDLVRAQHAAELAERTARLRAARLAAGEQVGRSPVGSGGRCSTCSTRQAVRRDGRAVRHDRGPKGSRVHCPGSGGPVEREPADVVG